MTEHRYFAFISYSRQDEASARWLHRALENYRLPRGLHPAALSGASGSPTRLRPVFRDEDELSASSDIGGALRERLAQSRHLLLLCSSASARSVWVNEEVAHWLGLGRDAQLLSIFVDEIPRDEADRNALLPPALREHCHDTGNEPLSVSIHRQRGDALLRIAAPVAGIEYAALADRHRRRRRRNMAWLALVAAIVATAGGRMFRSVLEERRVAESERLSAAAVKPGELDTDTRLLLAALALDLSPTPAARDALLALVEPGLRHSRQGHAGIVSAIAASDDGRYLVSGGRDGRAVLWDAVTLQSLSEVQAPDVGGAGGAENAIRRVGFTADGRGWVAVPEGGPLHWLGADQLEQRHLDQALVTPMPGSSLSPATLKSALTLSQLQGFREMEGPALHRPDLGLSVRLSRSGNLTVLRGVVPPGAQAVLSVRYLSSGQGLLMLTRGGGVAMQDTRSGAWTVIDDAGALAPPAASADGRHLAWLQRQGLALYEVATGQTRLAAFRLPAGRTVIALDFDRKSAIVGLLTGVADGYDDDRETRFWTFGEGRSLAPTDDGGELAELFGYAGMVGDGGGRYDRRAGSLAVQEGSIVKSMPEQTGSWILGRGMHAFPFEWDHSATAVITADCSEGPRYGYGDECSSTQWALWNTTVSGAKRSGTRYTEPFGEYLERGRMPPVRVALSSDGKTFVAQRGRRQLDVYETMPAVRLMATHTLAADIHSVQAHPVEPQRYLIVTADGLALEWNVDASVLRRAVCTIVARSLSEGERNALALPGRAAAVCP